MEIAPIWINLLPGICWWYPFHKWVKSSFSTAPDIFKPLLKRSIFKCISWLNGSFLGVNIGVFWKRKSKPKEWRQCRLSTRQLFFCLHIYSLCSLIQFIFQTFFSTFLLSRFTDALRTILRETCTETTSQTALAHCHAHHGEDCRASTDDWQNGTCFV